MPSLEHQIASRLKVAKDCPEEGDKEHLRPVGNESINDLAGPMNFSTVTLICGRTLKK